jgi:hypothetical protein
VKSWDLKKMATQFQTWKKKLYNEFVKKNLTSSFVENSPYKKLRDQWPKFVRYKTSKEGEERVRRNQENAERRHAIIKQDQEDTGLPFQSGKKWNKTWLPKGSIHFH